MSALMESACDEIESLAALMGYRDDGTPRIQPSAAARARYLLILTEEQAAAAGLAWHNPSITADEEGRLNFAWQIGERWALIDVGSGELFAVGTEAGDLATKPHSPSDQDCVELALWALAAPNAEETE